LVSFVLARVAIVLVLLALVVPSRDNAAAYQDEVWRDYWPTYGWEVATPESQGMDPGMLAWADQRFAAETPLLSSVVVVKGGRIVYERTANGYAPEERFHAWSVGKSVTNIAVGIALDEGALTSLDQTLGELIPDRIPEGADPRVWGITVEQLLTMTAGWAWDGRINFARAPETDDLDLMLGRPLQCDPGTCFEYDSGSSNLLSYIVQVRTGQLMADYLGPRLFEPLGIEQPYWITTEDGATRGGGGLYLTAREMAKIGYLYLNGGRWGEQQIVSRDWVERSTREHASGYGFFSGVNIGPGAYGYHWWIAYPSGYQAFVASGYGGQLVYVVPDLDLVVVTAYAQADATRPDLQQHGQPIIEEAIVPAALGGLASQKAAASTRARPSQELAAAST
jgi:CubicO group peptidase (beta-lactamase class C family)